MVQIKEMFFFKYKEQEESFNLHSDNSHMEKKKDD